MKAFRTTVGVVMTALCACAGGCSTDSMPWDDDSQVVAIRDARRTTDASGRTVVVVAPLRNPTEAPIQLASIGPGFAAAIRKDLSTAAIVAVRDEPMLGAEINTLLAQDDATISRRLPNLSARYPQVRLVVAGDVIRFTHRPAANTQQRRDAEVVVKVTVIDLPAARIVSSNTFTAQAWCDQAGAARVKPDTAFGTAQFWASPLGLASRDVVDDATKNILDAAPLIGDGQIRIVDQIDDRHVILSSGPITDASVGEVLFVCRRTDAGTEFKPMIDPVTQRPLTARISSGGREPTAWLMGAKPANTTLLGAVLCRQPGVVKTVSR
jgi:hypothetical protein